MKKYTFAATIQSAPRGGAFVFFPYDTQKEFGTIARVPVKVIFDGKVPYTGTIARYGHPQHMLGLLKAVQEQLGKGPGDSVDVVLWKDEAVRTVEVPADFAALLKKEKLQAAFDQLSFTHRKEYCRWITEAKKEETRAKRLAKSIEMLHKGIKTPG
jgi:hypothetical protein